MFLAVPSALMADGASEWHRQRPATYCATVLNMAGDTPQELRDAASAAHRRGNTTAAIALYRKILVLFPATPEAIEAVFYLSGAGKRARRPKKRTGAKETGS